MNQKSTIRNRKSEIPVHNSFYLWRKSLSVEFSLSSGFVGVDGVGRSCGYSFVQFPPIPHFAVQQHAVYQGVADGISVALNAAEMAVARSSAVGGGLFGGGFRTAVYS